jgi:hypothetical protein
LPPAIDKRFDQDLDIDPGRCPSISSAGVPAPLSFARQLPSMFNVDHLDSETGRNLLPESW